MKEIEKETKRKMMFTSGILSECDIGKIALIFTGRSHAGENLAKVLQQRESKKDHPIQMCDALSRNLPKEFKSILCNRLVHDRRIFNDFMTDFPEDCEHVIDTLMVGYKHDQEAKNRNLTTDQRLECQQTHSKPLM